VDIAHVSDESIVLVLGDSSTDRALQVPFRIGELSVALQDLLLQTYHRALLADHDQTLASQLGGVDAYRFAAVTAMRGNTLHDLMWC